MSESIYLDNAATTRVKDEVYESMTPFFKELYANPSSVYRFAECCRKEIEEARKTVAEFICAKPEEIYFTGGGSESDNWALKATAFAYKDKGKHIITSKIEHHAILHTCDYLQKLGFDITYINVDEYGVIKLDELKKAIRKDTILISIMYANNEIGTIQPIKEIGKIAHERGILFHSDAVQAYGHEEINVDELNIDMLSASGHKINGPKGIGIMYLRNTVKIGAFIHGGAQERGKRAGTYNTPGIVGFAKATELAKKNLIIRNKSESKLRDYLIERIENEIPYAKLNGHRSIRLSNNVNFSFRFIEGESMVIMLDQKGICVSSGSACTSGSLEPSHVLLAIGLLHENAHGSIRMTLSDETTKREIDYVVDELKYIVNTLRNMSPLYDDFKKTKEV